MPMKPKLLLSSSCTRPLGVVVVGVATINQQVTLFKKRGDLIHNRIHSRPGLDHHQDAAGTLQLADEVLEIGGSLNVLALSATVQEFLCFGVGAVVDNTGKSVPLGVEDEVLPHHAETDQTEVRLGHGLRDH